MISCYVQRGQYREALDLYKQMQSHKIVCTCAIHISLTACVTKTITQLPKIVNALYIQNLIHTLLIFHVKQIDFKTPKVFISHKN
jgi:pentatricopeptide repeat protein